MALYWFQGINPSGNGWGFYQNVADSDVSTLIQNYINQGNTMVSATKMVEDIGVPPQYETIQEETKKPSENPTDSPTRATIRSGAGVYYLAPPPLFLQLKKLRNRFISKKRHQQLHPLI